MTTQSKPASSKAPSHIAYQVRDRDGKGFGIQLDAVPLDGRITLRLLDDQPE